MARIGKEVGYRDPPGSLVEYRLMSLQESHLESVKLRTHRAFNPVFLLLHV